MIRHPYLIVFVLTFIIAILIYMSRILFPDKEPETVEMFCFVCGSKSPIIHDHKLKEDICLDCLKDLESGEA